MRFLWFILACSVLAACSSRHLPCQGIVPADLSHSITVADVPAGRTPFFETFVGDATGSTTILATSLNRDFDAATFDPTGRPVAVWTSQSADTHLRVLAQRSGYQLLTGDSINVARLETWSSAGRIEKATELERADKLSGAIDPRGGSLVAAVRLIPGAPRGLAYPWRLFVHRFDEKGASRHPAALLASDQFGNEDIIDVQGAVNTNGRAFVAWAVLTKPIGGPYPISGAWLTQDGEPTPSFSVGEATDITNLYVEPMADGSIAIATDHAWQFRIPDGQNKVEDAGWLSSFPRTRLGSVRAGRAYALLQGDPGWHRDNFGCQTSVPIFLVAAEGTTCGTLTLEPPIDSSRVCEETISSAALGRDGSVVVRTLEFGRDDSGALRVISFARWWPRLLQ